LVQTVMNGPPGQKAYTATLVPPEARSVQFSLTNCE
jgi:hypothetical protein